jgi:ketosteroid isomerase-like protein
VCRVPPGDGALRDPHHEFHPTPDPEAVVVEARGGAPLAGGTGEYWNDLILFIWFREGKIARQREYFTPLIRPT